MEDGPECLTEMPELDCLLAIEEDEIVGAVLFERCDARGYGIIRSIGVAKARQDCGIGTALKRLALDVCTAAGATQVMSEVDRYNQRMQAVNKKLGIPYVKDPDRGKDLLYAAPLRPDPTDLDI